MPNLQNYKKLDPIRVAEVEAKAKRLEESGKPRKIAAVLDKLPLADHIEIHFRTKTYEYVWSATVRDTPMGQLHYGIWLTDHTPYVHVVLASKSVLEHILALPKDLEPQKPKEN